MRLPFRGLYFMFVPLVRPLKNATVVYVAVVYIAVSIYAVCAYITAVFKCDRLICDRLLGVYLLFMQTPLASSSIYADAPSLVFDLCKCLQAHLLFMQASLYLSPIHTSAYRLIFYICALSIAYLRGCLPDQLRMPAVNEYLYLLIARLVSIIIAFLSSRRLSLWLSLSCARALQLSLYSPR